MTATSQHSVGEQLLYGAIKATARPEDALLLL